MASAEFTIRVLDAGPARALLEAAILLDDCIAEFGYEHPEFIGEAYQRFHDALHDLKKEVSSRG